eukprot:12418825-Karenia_brevis.AAC.1
MLESIQGIVNGHDDALDRARNVAMEQMQRTVGVLRGEGERIVDNMGEVMENLRDSNLEAVGRVGRELDRQPRDLNAVEN